MIGGRLLSAYVSPTEGGISIRIYIHRSNKFGFCVENPPTFSDRGIMQVLVVSSIEESNHYARLR